MMCCLRIAGLVLWVVSAALVSGERSAAQEGETTVTPLVGASVRGKGVSVKDGKVVGEGLPAGLKLEDVRRMEPVRMKGASETVGGAVASGSGEVRLVGGSVLLVKGLVIAEEELRLSETSVGELKVPVESVRSIRWCDANEVVAVETEEKTPLAEQDKFLLRVEGKVTTTQGILVELTADELVFTFEGEDRRVARKDLVAIVVAQASVEEPSVACEVQMETGERLCGVLKELGEGKLKMVVLEDRELSMALAKVAWVKMHSDRVVMLSGKKPTDVVQKSIVAPARMWQVNRSVQGNPLTLGKEVFAEGMGVSAYTALTFELDGKYERFAAVIGIDQETQGHGNCVFRVMGDGRELFQKKKMGSESGEGIEVVIRGVRRLTLVVDPGEELDLADHADWCDARVLRSGP